MNLLLFKLIDFVALAGDPLVLRLHRLLDVFHLGCLKLQLLLQLLVVCLLFLDDRVTLDNLLFGLLELLFHFLDLALIHSVSVCQLVRLLLQGGDQGLRLLDQRFLVFDLTLKRLDQHHLLCD